MRSSGTEQPLPESPTAVTPSHDADRLQLRNNMVCKLQVRPRGNERGIQEAVQTSRLDQFSNLLSRLTRSSYYGEFAHAVLMEVRHGITYLVVLVPCHLSLGPIRGD